MKKGHVILSAVALVISAAGALAFKAKMGGGHQLNATTASHGCLLAQCFTTTGANLGGCTYKTTSTGHPVSHAAVNVYTQANCPAQSLWTASIRHDN